MSRSRPGLVQLSGRHYLYGAVRQVESEVPRKMGWLRNKVVEPIKAQLLQGVSPGRLALALALGVVVGVFPVLGATTALCALVGFALKLNQPAIQVANYLAYPLQLLLFIPFFQSGAMLLGAPPVEFSLAQLQAELTADPGATILRYLGANLRAVAAWALVAPVAAFLLHWPLRAVLSRLPLPADPAPGR